MSRKKADDLDRARAFLARYRPAQVRVELLQKRLERLRDRAGAPRSPNLSGLPHGNMTSDATGELAAELEDTKNELAEARAEADAIRAEIKRELRILPNATEDQVCQRMVLQSRYVDGEQWDEINEILFGDNEDYTDKLESYRRRCFKLHDRALKSLSKILMEDM